MRPMILRTVDEDIARVPDQVEATCGTSPIPERNDLARALQGILPKFIETEDPAVLREVHNRVEFLEVAAGTLLIKQGDIGDDVYFVLGGRLRAVREDRDGSAVTLGEIGRGETVGELALILSEPRSASIYAVRDSVVARLKRADFHAVLQKEPWLGVQVARIALERYRRAMQARRPPRKPVNICLLPMCNTVDILGFAQSLSVARSEYGGPVRVITVEELHDKFGRDGDEQCPLRHGAVVEWLTSLESASEALILVADPDASAWTQRCIRQADEILLVGEADGDCKMSDVEWELFEGDHPVPPVFRSLVLLHPADRRMPRNTAAWLEPRRVQRHFHIRKGMDGDMRRLARTLAGRAIGVVLAGGGAPAFVHFGVLNAMHEAGIDVDFIGGTSMGATVASWRALGLTGKALLDAGRKVYLNDPTSDVNFLPMMSLVRGLKVRRVTREAISDVAGEQVDIEDLWVPFFCIATNLSEASEEVLMRGPLDQALLATFSIPGALPPVPINGQLMVDGGMLNNFPVDVMERLGVGTIIGVDVAEEEVKRISVSELPGSFELLLDRLRPLDQRKYALPLLPEILLTSTIIASRNRQRIAREHVDLLVQPRVEGVGLVDWARFEEVVAMGRHHAEQMLASLTPAMRERLR